MWVVPSPTLPPSSPSLHPFPSPHNPSLILHFLFSLHSPFHTKLPFLPSSSLQIHSLNFPSLPPPFPFSLSTLSFISFTAEPSARSLWQCQHCPQQQLQSVWQVHPTRLPAQWPGGRSRIGTVSAGEITRLRSGTKCKRSNITTSV